MCVVNKLFREENIKNINRIELKNEERDFQTTEENICSYIVKTISIFIIYYINSI
jgi:hypothetical protein